MGPPRRSRSNSSVSNHNIAASHHNQRFRQPSTHPPLPSSDPPHQDPLPQTHSGLGMSPASRYMANMKVIRRRDSSIVSIFDQFSHVCVYHHNGDRWEKQGYEGSMFLYERDSYPPYGLYIMNRVGMDDYIQRLYPEDSVGVHGSYLMMRHYLDFTSRRLAETRSKLPLSMQDGPATKFAPEFAIADPEKLQDADKGHSQTVGLWCFATDAREPMTDVLMRLHGYIKRNMPYPDEFRYGPERPPPPNFRSTSRASERGHHFRSASSASNNSSFHSISESGEEEDPSNTTPANDRNVSELDKLFAKLGGVASNGPSKSQVQSSSGTSGSGTTAASLLASFSAPSRAMSVPPPSSSTVTAASRGLALLDTIFASATPPPARVASRSGSTFQPQPPPACSHDPYILSPKPTSTALPQVLNQEVVSSLLGLPPSRASSVRYEGDNEASDDGASEPGSLTASIPQLFVPTTDVNENDGDWKIGGRILGDVTPRPALRGFGSDINQVSDLLTAARVERHHNHYHTPSSGAQLQLRPSSSNTTITSISADIDSTPTIDSHHPRTNHNSVIGPTMTATNNAPKPRPLVPFEADSDLWPYPRAPFVETDSDVIELDFADTSALSDPEAFEKRVAKGKNRQKRGKKDRQKEREEIERSWDVPAPLSVASLAVSAPAPAPAPAPISAPDPPHMVNGKAKHHVRAESSNSVSQSTNANAHTHAHSAKVDMDGIQSSLLSALSSQNNSDRLSKLTRKDFVSEVLSLIYTNTQFVDDLYREYASQAG